MDKQNLRLFSIEVRSKLIHEHRFYVPPRSVVCEYHRALGQWKKEDLDDSELIPYTVENIEEMIDLLRFKPKSLKYEDSGI